MKHLKNRRKYHNAIPTEGLVHDWNTENATVDGSNFVTLITDAVGSENLTDYAGTPLWESNQINGLSAVYHDGINDVLITPTLSTTFDDYTFAFVARMVQTVNAQNLIFWEGGASVGQIRIGATNTPDGWRMSNDGFNVGGSTDQLWHTFVLVNNETAGSEVLYVDGVSTITNNSTTTIPLTRVVIAANVNPARQTEIQWARGLVYNYPLEGTELNRLFTSLNYIYGF